MIRLVIILMYIALVAWMELKESKRRKSRREIEAEDWAKKQFEKLRA